MVALKRLDFALLYYCDHLGEFLSKSGVRFGPWRGAGGLGRLGAGLRGLSEREGLSGRFRGAGGLDLGAGLGSAVRLVVDDGLSERLGVRGLATPRPGPPVLVRPLIEQVRRLDQLLKFGAVFERAVLLQNLPRDLLAERGGGFVGGGEAGFGGFSLECRLRDVK